MFAGSNSDDVEEVTITVDGHSTGHDPQIETDRRLARISNAQASVSGSSSRRRRIYEAEVIVDSDTEGAKDDVVEGDVLEGDSALLRRLEAQRDEEDDDVAARRRRIKERLAIRRGEQQQQEDTSSPAVSGFASRRVDRPASPVDESSGSSEYETESEEESDEDEDGGRPLLKPLFVPRARRETLRTQEELDKEQEAARQKELLRAESKKQQTRLMLAESIRRQEEIAAHGDVTDMDSDAGLPDDTDDPNDDDEFQQWRVREMGRMKREAETREAMLLEAQDIDRRRNMTDEERLAEDIKLGKFRDKEKKQWKFLQKYYHKGVFYMDESSVGGTGTRVDERQELVDRKAIDARLRDYSEPTLDDNYNKEQLPAVLQVKKFGMRGRTKYTHLTDQDTTDFRAPFRPNDAVKESYMAKRSGVGDINTAGRARKKPRNE